jgi:hypothetical protein
MAGGYIHNETHASTEKEAMTLPKEVSEEAPCGSVAKKPTPTSTTTPTTEAE